MAGPSRRVIDGVIFGEDERVGRWVQDQLGGGDIAGPYVALGVENAEGELIFGIIFFNHHPGRDIEVAMAATDIRPAMPASFRRIAEYPFITLGLPRLTAFVHIDNHRVRRFAEGIGCKFEGIKRATDEIMYGLLPSEFIFYRQEIQEISDGQRALTTQTDRS